MHDGVDKTGLDEHSVVVIDSLLVEHAGSEWRRIALRQLPLHSRYLFAGIRAVADGVGHHARRHVFVRLAVK